MYKPWSDCLAVTLLASIIALPLYCLSSPAFVNAAQRTLVWSMVDTPNNTAGGIIASDNTGINAIALGPDNKTFYAADTSNDNFYKSIDAGVTWSPQIETRLKSVTGATALVWNLTVSLDDPNFILAVTGDNILGPNQVFFSGDGGNNWKNTNLPALGIGEYISCLDISKIYGTTGKVRDIAVGTRDAAGSGGQIFSRQFSSSAMGSWKSPVLPTPSPCNISSVKFSPNYPSDYTVAVITSTPSATFLNLAQNIFTGITPLWNDPTYPNYPVQFTITSPTPKVITSTNLIRSGLEIPSDFTGTPPIDVGCFVSLQADNTTAVLYVNVNNLANKFYDITPTLTAPQPGITPAICSIAYKGTGVTGILMAGEASTNPVRGLVNVWQSANAQSSTSGAATWTKSDAMKSPSGGGNSGRANALLDWSDDGDLAYCGTSSDNATVGGTGAAPGQWPFSQLVSQLFDESAFSRSADSGISWNQIGLINTRIDQLSDVAALEINPDVSSATLNSTLYLATLNENTTVADSFDSVWRSTSDPLGRIWERVLLKNTSDGVNGTILRVNSRTSPSGQTSQAIVFADLGTDNITYSADRGQLWETVQAGVTVNDISLATDTRLYILEDQDVRQVNRGGSGWLAGSRLNTNLLSNGHTICTPRISSGTTDIVIVGSDFRESSVAWADFSQILAQFTPLKSLPVNGDVHVIADSRYNQSPYIYAGINDNPSLGTDGTIYRWLVGKSTDWDDMRPTDRVFYGLEMLDDVLYGAFDWNTTDLSPSGGVDRTLNARDKVPPPPEWNYLTSGLPLPPNQVNFTREPSSLKISSNTYNTLWAIDNNTYNYTTNIGRLWMYVDSIAKLGPWPTSPPTGSTIGADPVSGRGQQIDFKWRPLTDIFGYDVLIAKDVNFTLLLSQQLNVAPVDDRTGAWIVIPADQEQPSAWISPGLLETGRPYYWRVRGSQTINGDNVSSPWSPVMLFYIKPGFIVTADYPGPGLLTPVNGPCAACKSPVRFSWTPIKNAVKYEFILASDPELINILIKTTTGSTAFDYKDRLEFDRPYYWQVKATAPVISDPSPVGTFTITSLAPTTPQETQVKKKAVSTGTPFDIWIWVIIVISVLLLMLINLYAFLSRNRD